MGFVWENFICFDCQLQSYYAHSDIIFAQVCTFNQDRKQEETPAFEKEGLIFFFW